LVSKDPHIYNEDAGVGEEYMILGALHFYYDYRVAMFGGIT